MSSEVLASKKLSEDLRFGILSHLDQISDGLALVLAEGLDDLKVVFGNAVFHAILNYPNAFCIQKNLNTIFSLPKDASLMREFVRSKKEKCICRIEYGLDLPCKGFTLLHWTIIPILQDDKVHHFMVLLTENTGAKQKHLEQIGLYATQIAHDFNNILAFINSSLDFLRLKLKNNKELAMHLDNLQKASQRGSSLVFELLANNSTKPQVVNLRDSISQEAIAFILQERQDIAVEVLVQDVWVHASLHHVDAIVRNLCINAKDAMPGGGLLRVFVEDLPESSYALLEISDTGIGMDASTQKKIFEPFFTNKVSNTGTGLGLFTVKQIMSQCGGYIELDSQVGKGSAFKLFFRKANIGAQEKEQDLPLGNATIMLIETDSSQSAYIYSLLALSGYRVKVYPIWPSVQEFLEEDYDLIIFQNASCFISSSFYKEVIQLKPYLKFLILEDGSSKREDVHFPNLFYYPKKNPVSNIVKVVQAVLLSPPQCRG